MVNAARPTPVVVGALAADAATALRMDELERFAMPDEDGDRSLEELVLLAATVCEAPLAVIVLYDGDREVVVAAHGFAARDSGGLALASAVLEPTASEPVVVADASTDARLAAAALVAGEPHVRWLAAARLVTEAGVAVGALCVMDRKPRERDARGDRHLAMLPMVARQVMAVLDLRARRRGEEHYRVLFDRNPLPMWVYDLETLRFLAVNDAAVKHYGYTREQFLAMTIADIRPREDHAALVRAVEIDSEGLGSSGLWRHRLVDGRMIRVEISSHRLTFEGRRARLVLAHDVTSRLAAGEALKASEASLARAQRIAQVGSWELDLATSRLTWSDETYRVFGIDKQRLGASYDAFLATVHPDDREAMQRAQTGALAGEHKLDVEHRIVRSDGQVRWVHEVGELEYDDLGRPRRLTGTVLDITKRKRDELLQTLEGRILNSIVSSQPLEKILADVATAVEAVEPSASGADTEAGTVDDGVQALRHRIRDLTAIAYEHDRKDRALRGSEERFRLLATATNDAVWDWDMRANELWWGNGVTRLFGVDMRDVDPGLAWWATRIHPDDRARVMLSLDTAIADGASNWSDYYRFQRADGSYAHVQDRGQIMRDASGTAVRMIGGISDVTERRHLEQQLLRAQRLESLGTLAGGIAHDLNNTLQPILMTVDLLRAASSNAEMLEDVAMIEACAQRGANMVKQLLAFARGGDVQRSPLALDAIAAELAKILRDTFPKNIALAVDVAPGLSRVVANATQIHQLVLNLCVNARDAMPDGGTLNVSLRNVRVDTIPPHAFGDARQGDHVAIEVTDTGTGIPAEQLEQVFDPFFTTKEPGKGTGLGLSTAHAIARGHGGFVTVASTPGCGSTFRVYLPALAAAPDAPEVPAGPAARPADGATVLVIDDEEHVRKAVKRMLERNGYRVVLATSGGEALETFRAMHAEVDVVLVDLAMPGMDGSATIVGLSAIDPGVHIIGASGCPSPEFIAAVEQFVAKPFTVQAILDAIAGVLSRRAAP